MKNTLLAILLLSSTAQAQTENFVYCQSVETQEIRIFNWSCPAGWFFVGFVN